MKEIVLKYRDDHVMLWLDNFRDGRPLSEIVDDVYTKPGYSAAVDFPTVAVWKELAAIYPNAKIILTERESPEAWWESASQTIFAPPGFVFRILISFSPFFQNQIQMCNHMFSGVFRFNEPRATTMGDKDAAIQSYMRNSEEARTFDPERTLIFDVRQGWEPLCNFLGKDIPSTPFPHSNTRADFHKLVAIVTYSLVLPPILLLITFIYLIRRYLTKQKKFHEA
jgi:hypothetical protein